MAAYEIWTDPYPGENALRHEYHHHNEELSAVIEAAKRMAETEDGVRVVEVSTEGDRRVTVLWEAESPRERRMAVCKRCGNQWEPRVDDPVRCPNCKSQLWDTDRVRAPRKPR